MSVLAIPLKATLLLAISAIAALLLLEVASAQAEGTDEPLATASPSPTAQAPVEETISPEPEAVPAVPSEPEAAAAPSPEPALPEPAEVEPVAAVEKAVADQTEVVEQVAQTVSTADLESAAQTEAEVVATTVSRVKESAAKIAQGTATTARRTVNRTVPVWQAVDQVAAFGGGGSLTKAPTVATDTPALSEQPSWAPVNLRSDQLGSAGSRVLPLADLGLRHLAMFDAFDSPGLVTFDVSGPAATTAAGWHLGSVSDLVSTAGERSRNLTHTEGNDLAPPPPSPQSAAAGSGGSPSFVPVAALLALLALVAPATYRRLRDGPAFPAPAPFVCALERPG